MSVHFQQLKYYLKDSLAKKKKAKRDKKNYAVPSSWHPVGKPIEGKTKELKVVPEAFFLKHIEAIEKNAVKGIDPSKSLNSQIDGGKGGTWLENETIYNMFVRVACAYDHDSDEQIGCNKKDITAGKNGYRETGTMLKAIALLGHIKELGFTTVYLLPVTASGKSDKKGDLGSPYGIRNPYKIEETLADPLVPEMDASELFAAFVEAAHMLGMRVICEFVFRTASKDSDWIPEHPDWFYWINTKVKDRKPGETDLEKAKKTYGNPIFDEETLKAVKAKVAANDFTNMPPPPQDFIDFFKTPPAKDTIKKNKNGNYIGTSVDPISGKKYEVRIPGAFADWPPDDNQPPWTDVTYLKMFVDENPEKPEFNYIAYNTIRMFDSRLNKVKLANKKLWQKLADIIPDYQDKYGIDGVMIDMGHAVPVPLMQRIISKAREKDPNFAFLSENFDIDQSSVEAGYNAVIGYAWWVEYKRDGMLKMLNHIGNQGVPIHFLGAAENHNTPRALAREGSLAYAKQAFLVNTMLPRAIPFLHSGQELSEVQPINTGLDFTDAQIKEASKRPLPLFDKYAYNWNGRHEMTDYVKKVLGLRKRYEALISQTDTKSFYLVPTKHPDVIAYLRFNNNGEHALVIFNRDYKKSYNGTLDLGPAFAGWMTYIEDQLSDKELRFQINGTQLKYDLKPGQSCFFAWKK